MKYLHLITLVFSFTLTVQAQVGISSGHSLPDVNAMLDIKSNTKGLLIPRTSTTTRNSMRTSKGLLVYDTTTASFWYHTGTTWNELSSDNSGWNLTGNSNTQSSFFFGTRDNQPIRFRLNNTWSGEWDHQNRNYFIGLRAGVGNTTATGNIAIGSEALRMNGAEEGLVAIGDSALYNNGIGGYNNTAIGALALRKNISGNDNAALGYGALIANTMGALNVAIGNKAMGSNTTGINNTAIGHMTMLSNISGGGNTALGSVANVMEGSERATAIGAGSLANCSDCLILGKIGTKVGINSTNPLTDLHIVQQSNANGNATRGIRLQQSTTGNYWRTFIDPGNNYVFEYMNGVFAYIDQTGIFHNFSDARLKKDIIPLGNVLQKVLLLQPTTYHYTNSNAGSPLMYGFLAQDVEKVFPAFVSTGERGFKSMAYANFSVVAIKAIQEQQQTIDVLKARIEKLEKLLLQNQ